MPALTVVVFGKRIDRGEWRPWERICMSEDMDGVLDSAIAKSLDRGRYGQPSYEDYLDGARYIFNIAYGSRERPANGDTRVFGILMNDIVIGEFEEMERCFKRSAS
jgi:hypothetical protein